MRGFVKCDICGRFYRADENERYDGLSVFYYGSNGVEECYRHDFHAHIIEKDGSDSGIPLKIDTCSDCFYRFVNWAKMCKDDAERGV